MHRVKPFRLKQQKKSQGKNLASGKIQVNAQDVNLDNAQTSANRIEAQALQGSIQANNSTVIVNRDLTQIRINQRKKDSLVKLP